MASRCLWLGKWLMKQPKILFFDIETAGVNALRSDLGFVLMCGFKWNYEKQVRVFTITQKELKNFNDGPLLTRLSKEYAKADLTVAHFGTIFDRRFLQGRLLIHNLPPIPPTRMRDTCLIARSVANFSSNRLKNLGDTLKLKHRKMDKGDGWPEWWFGAMRGDMSAIHKMAKYCRDDVLALEELYYRLLPFDNAHPRIYNDDSCRSCGGKVQHRGMAFIGERKYRRWQCVECGKWDRSRKAL